MSPLFVEAAPRINLRWILRLRWLAVAGQTASVLLASRFLSHNLPVRALLLPIAAVALFNLVSQIWLYGGGEPTDRACGLHLLVDVAELTAMLLLSGGATNPFALLYLVHITIAAVILPGRWILLVSTFSALAYSALQLMAPGPLSAEDPSLLRLGTWAAFLVAASFVSTFCFRMSQALREREEELGRARSDAEASERLAALGTLAAGTAHELNTPLGTIAILAGELSAQLSGEPKSDVDQIRKQVARCREIITSMLAPRGGAEEEPEEFELAAELEAVVRRWQEGRPTPHPHLHIAPAARRGLARLPRRGFEQALKNLLDNAAEATEGRPDRDVRIELSLNDDELSLCVSDNGVGVPEPLLRRVGQPYFTTKGPGRGSGLGLFLARNVFERQGGTMSVDSAEGRGTRVTLTVPEGSA